jgi:CBS domain-containing protein
MAARLALKDFPRPKHLVCVPSTATVLEAVEVLSHHRILAAPVQDAAAPAGAPWTSAYVGVVDMLDVVRLLAEETDAAGGATSVSAALVGSALGLFPVTSVASRAARGPFVALPESCSWLDAFLLLCKSGVRRLFVLGEFATVVNIITQVWIFVAPVARPEQAVPLGWLCAPADGDGAGAGQSSAACVRFPAACACIRVSVRHTNACTLVCACMCRPA